MQIKGGVGEQMVEIGGKMSVRGKACVDGSLVSDVLDLGGRHLQRLL